MAFDLTNHFPLGPAEGVSEKGYTLLAWQPANNTARRVLVVQAKAGEEIVAEAAVAMSHTNIFGVDVEDMASLEKATNRLMTDLPERA